MRRGQRGDPGPQGLRQCEVEVADIIATTLIAPVGELDPTLAASLKARVAALAAAHPLYPDLSY